MFAKFGYILATMFATIASLFSGHVVGDAAPPPPYVNVPGSFLTVPSNFGNRQNTPTGAVTQSALTASAAVSQASHTQSVSSPQTSAPVASEPVATTTEAKPDEPQGILCHGTYYDACPADTTFQCLERGRLCRPTSAHAQILSTTPEKSACQIQEDQITAQIIALQQNPDNGNTGTSSPDGDTASKIADLQAQFHTLQSSCSS